MFSLSLEYNTLNKITASEYVHPSLPQVRGVLKSCCHWLLNGIKKNHPKVLIYCDGDEERDEILDAMTKNILLKCGKWEFVGKNEASLKTHFTIKHVMR